MKPIRKKREPIEVPSDVRLILRPIPESSEDFQKRVDQVQDIFVRMILIARKNGRPKANEEEYEEAA